MTVATTTRRTSGSVANCLRDVEIRCTDFELCLADVTAADFVYMDPPYYKQGGYSDFDRYTKWKFRENDMSGWRPSAGS